MSQYLNLKPVDFDKLSAKRQAAVQWEGRILLPKYDGCFCIVLLYRGELRDILSRDGKTVKSMSHIYDDLVLRYPWLLTWHEQAPLRRGLALLGEAWKPGTEFKDISGSFRRQRPQPDLGFAVFDIVEYNVQEDGTPSLFSPYRYRERLALLQDARPGLCNVFPPLPIECLSREHAEEYARNCKKLGGYDGAIASDPDAPYVVSDGHGEFLKIKPLMSFTLQCVGVERSKGEKTGRDTCALLVRFKGTTCKVGTGLSEEEQANPEQFILKMIEVQCMDVYPGPEGLMREPRFCGVRDDATPDY